MAVEDEVHFLLHCPAYSEERTRLWDAISATEDGKELLKKVQAAAQARKRLVVDERGRRRGLENEWQQVRQLEVEVMGMLLSGYGWIVTSGNPMKKYDNDIVAAVKRYLARATTKRERHRDDTSRKKRSTKKRKSTKKKKSKGATSSRAKKKP